MRKSPSECRVGDTQSGVEERHYLVLGFREGDANCSHLLLPDCRSPREPVKARDLLAGSPKADAG